MAVHDPTADEYGVLPLLSDHWRIMSSTKEHRTVAPSSRSGDGVVTRVIPFILLVLTAGAGLASRQFLTGFWAKYLGVALWAAAVYFLVMTIRPLVRPRVALVVALAVSWVVELAQLTGIPKTLSGIHPLLRLVFGETFSPFDLIALTVGAGAAFGLGLFVLPPLWRVRELKQMTAEIVQREGTSGRRIDAA